MSMQSDIKSERYVMSQWFPENRSLDDKLNALSLEGREIISVSVIAYEFKKDGSNHGHGGHESIAYLITHCKNV